MRKTNSLPGDTGQTDLTEALQLRVHELEDFMQRVEADAAKTVEMAEELAVAKQLANAAQRRAENSESRTKSILDTVVDGIISISENGEIESLNASALRMFGTDEPGLIGRNLSDVVCHDEDKSLYGDLFPWEETPRDGASNTTISCTGRPFGAEPFPAELIVTRLEVSGQSKYTCVLRDVTERKNAEKAIEKLALYDQLTGAVNRHEFQQRLNRAISRSRREGLSTALFLLDLDKFKDINDTYGHPVGDALLTSVAEVLSDTIRDSDTVARIGGDEFAIILQSIIDPLRIRRVAERIIQTVSEPKVLDGSLVSTGISIGISLYPRDATDSKELIRLCDKALYEAKRRGRGNYQFFDVVMDADARSAQILENDLRLALVRGELDLHYQPQIDAQSGKLTGAEALVRWRHPVRGLLLPGEFIPQAEQCGLVIELGKRVLEAACEEIHAQDLIGIEPFPIAVNVSPLQFHKDDFLELVADILNRTGVDPRRLELELTENVLIEDPEKVIAKLGTIRELGVGIAIDDFGTGYSSLSYLRNFPVRKLKIAQTFIQNFTQSAHDEAIAQAIINLGQSLDIQTVAEGVETAQQVEAIRKYPCTTMQGFYFCEPLSQSEFRDWLKNS